MEGMLVSGVAVDKNAARIAVIGIKDEPGMALRSLIFWQRKILM